LGQIIPGACSAADTEFGVIGRTRGLCFHLLRRWIALRPALPRDAEGGCDDDRGGDRHEDTAPSGDPPQGRTLEQYPRVGEGGGGVSTLARRPAIAATL